MQKRGIHFAASIKGGWKIGLLLLMAAVVIVAAAFFVPELLYSEPEEYTLSKNVFLDHITINGIDVGGMTYNDALDAIVLQAQEAQSTWSLSINCNNFTYSTISYSTIGIHVDYASIEAALREAWTYGHRGDYKSYKVDVEYLAQSPYNVSVGLTQGTGDKLDYILGIIADNVYVAPTDAQIIAFDPARTNDPFVIQSETYGRKIDVEAAKEEILRRASADESGAYTIQLEQIQPEVTQEMLRENVKLLATGKNAIDKYSTPERTDNIRLAFSKINGYILENGKTFSFNKVVGNRKLENGYKSALGYVSGELVEVVGGGVCQASTTLYSAALRAGLTITEREPHSMPVSYIELGQDATVNYMRGHMIDLKFKNETGYPIYITAAVEENASGRLMSVVRIYGHALEDGVYYLVESNEIETLPIPEQPIVRVDETGKYVKYKDKTYHYSKGSEGHVVETYRLKMRDSVVVEKVLISTDTYKAQPKIDYIGAEERI